ncbi:MAG: DUF2147 domain-containing protein [Steroidobacteraceae bacterium]
MPRRSRSDRRRWLLASLMLCGLSAFAVAAVRAADDAGRAAPAAVILGNWVTQPRDGIIQISMTPDGAYQGRVIGGSNPHRLDQMNPDPSRRRLELLGAVIMRNMRYQGRRRWSGGTIYDPANGRTYQCQLQLQDAQHLQVRGFLGITLLGRSQLWTRYAGTSMLLPRLR